MKEYKIKKDWEGPYDKFPSCIYNRGVGCDKKDCEHCGWNPFVSLYRITTTYGFATGDYLTKSEN